MKDFIFCKQLMFNIYNKNTVRGIIALLTVIVFTVLGVSYLSLPRLQEQDSPSFSALRAAEDIRIISEKPHSIQHPENRMAVCAYLTSRLRELGASPMLYTYDSVAFRTGGYGQVTNIYAEFPSNNPDTSGTYVLLMAHYDSCFEQDVLGKKVFSYGAADDGYGVSVVLELVREALTYRDEWNQGIKVLFTDGEENRMSGMKNALDKDRYLFDNVGCVINVEARGVRGPAYLFETSSGNDRLMHLYEKAKSPFSYSLSSAIYRILPNYTDFSLLKDSIPGYNFAVLENLRYYHTDLDNYSNISLKSIQHYGCQISPVLREYLTNGIYSDREYLKSDSEKIVFTVPFMGMFLKSYNHYIVFMIEVLIFLVLFVIFTVVFKITSCKSLLINSLKLLGFSILLFLAGTFLAWLSALSCGDRFSMTGTKYVWFDNILLIISLLTLFILYLRYYIRKSRVKDRYYLKSMVTASCVMGFLSLVVFVPLKENFFLVLPVAITVLSALICRLRLFRWVSLVGMAFIALLAGSFLYVLYTALTIGALGVILFLAFYYLVLIAGLFNCYIYQWK